MCGDRPSSTQLLFGRSQVKTLLSLLRTYHEHETVEQYWKHWTEIIVIMKLSLTLCLALASTVSGFLIKISEKLSTADCQDVLNNLEVCIQDVKSLLQN